MSHINAQKYLLKDKDNNSNFAGGDFTKPSCGLPHPRGSQLWTLITEFFVYRLVKFNNFKNIDFNFKKIRYRNKLTDQRTGNHLPTYGGGFQKEGGILLIYVPEMLVSDKTVFVHLEQRQRCSCCGPYSRYIV